MGVEHVNRRGVRYYIHQGRTKTGKAKYYASREPTSEKGTPADSLPDDFEVYEDPSNCRVYVRRRRPTRILPHERDFVHRMACELGAHSRVLTVVEDDQIVIYTPDQDPIADANKSGQTSQDSSRLLFKLIAKHANFSAELRFILADVDQRIFLAERYAIDRWIQLSPLDTLESLAKQLLPYLGRGWV